MSVQVSIKETVYTLKKADKDELPQIVAIYNQGIGTANADMAPVSVESRLAWFDAHDEKRPLVVLKVQDAVVAWASLSNLYERPAYRHSSEISIYVDAHYQGCGLGAYLLTHLMQQAKTLDISSIVALIYGHNEASLGLFKKYGFVQWGVLPRVCLSFGKLADVVILGWHIE